MLCFLKRLGKQNKKIFYLIEPVIFTPPFCPPLRLVYSKNKLTINVPFDFRFAAKAGKSYTVEATGDLLEVEQGEDDQRDWFRSKIYRHSESVI